jgi:hypothetical protein
MAISGCDSRPHRLPLQGRITVDGKPLVFGSILFVPEGAGPKAAATIRDGQYLVEQRRGPLSGRMIVEVRAPKLPTDKPLADDTEKLIYDTVNAAETLPPRYNRQSELRVTVTEAGPNEFDFDLQSK